MNTLYQDGLIEITDEKIVFQHYYFPFGSAKRVPLSQIESIQAKPPSFFGGSWRIWGSGDPLFRTWFPLDGARPSRDLIFIATLRGRSVRVGFTVEHSQPVIGILEKLGLLNGSHPASSLPPSDSARLQPLNASAKNENVSPEKNKYWFPAKKYGWGWGFPNCRLGVVVFLVWLACHLVGGILFAKGLLSLKLFVAWTILLAAVLLIIVVIKGEPPRWRWGDKSDKDKSGSD